MRACQATPARPLLVNRFTKFFGDRIRTVQGMPNPAQQHDFKGLKDWIAVFRAGDHVDSTGKACSFTTADLDQMAANVALSAPPAVLGHPKHNDPAYAWGRQVKRDGDTLFMKFEDILPAFEAGVDSGAYRNRSVSVVKDAQHGWRIRHVGWLGAVPPAIDGLQPLDYSADEAALEFSAEISAGTVSYALSDVSALLRGLRDYVISTAGLDQANAVLPAWRIDSIADAATRIGDAANQTTNPFTAPAGAETMLTQADLDRTAAETEARVRAEFAAAQATQAAEFTAATALNNRLLAERRAERIATQINGWKAAGNLLPAEEAGLAEFMAALEAGQAATFEFAAAGAVAGAAPTKKTPAEFFAEFVAARGRLVKLGKTDDVGDIDPALNTQDTRAIAKAAQDFQAAEAKAGRQISIDVAVAHVVRGTKA